MNFEGKPCEASIIKSLECDLVSEIGGTTIKCCVVCEGCKYEITYQPTIKGRHQLHIKVEGEHVRGSPFRVAVKAPVKMLGAPILTIGGVSKPWGVAINRRREVVVAEGGRHCVSVFSPSRDKIRSLDIRDSAHDHWQIRGVAVDGEGNIFVTDKWNDCIKKLTAQGQFLTEGSGPSLSYPNNVSFNSANGMVYVADCRIHILNSDLSFSSTFGKEGTGKGQFCG